MSLDSILERILGDAEVEKERIMREGKIEKDRIIQEAKKEAENLYQEILARQKAIYESQKQRLIVNERLQAKKNLLETKQELIDSVFSKLKTHIGKDKLKKQLVSADKVQVVSEDIDFYLNKLRPDFEAEIERILFE